LPHQGSWFDGFGLLYLAEIFVWSLLCSLLIKQPLWGVVTAISAQWLMLYFAFPFFTNRHQWSAGWSGSIEPLIPLRIGFVLVLGVTDIVLGKLWFEDRLRLPRWRFRL